VQQVTLAPSDLVTIGRILDLLDEEHDGTVNGGDLIEALTHAKLSCGSGNLLVPLFDPDEARSTAEIIAKCSALVPSQEGWRLSLSGTATPQPHAEDRVPEGTGARRASIAKRVVMAMRTPEPEVEVRPHMDPEMADLAARLREKVRQYRDLRDAFRHFDIDKSGT
jgi:hypothetical protein